MNQTIDVAKQMGKLLTGRFTGRQHFAKCCEILAGLPSNSMITLNFFGTEYVSASWINAMLLPLIAFAGDEKNDFYVVIQHFPKISLTTSKWSPSTVGRHLLSYPMMMRRSGVLYGTLDPGQRRRCRAVLDRGEVTGVALATERTKAKGLSGAAWNNRLRDLNVKRVLRRRREGREQIYSAVLPEVQING